MITESVPETAEPPFEPQQGRVAKNASVYLVSQIISWVVTFATVSIIPRRIGELGMGELGIAGAATSAVLAFMGLGVDQYLVKEIGRDRRQIERLIRAAFGLRFVLSLIAVLLAGACLAAIHPNREIWMIGVLMLASAPLFYLYSPLRAALAGLEEAKSVAMLDIAAAASSLAAIPFLAHGPVTIPVVSLITTAGLFAAACGWLRRTMRLAPTADFALWMQILRGGLPFVANNFIVQLYASVAVLLLNRYADIASVGVYTQAQRLFGTFLFVPTAIGAALLPSLARLAQASPHEFQQQQSRVLSLLVVLGLPVTVCVMLLAHPLTLLLYGADKFVEMPAALQIYALAIIPMYIVSTMYQFLVAQNRNAVWAFFLMASVVIYALASMTLIPYTRLHYHNGAMGAIAATFIAESISVLFAFILLKNNPFTLETMGRILRALIAAAGMTGVMLLIAHGFALLPAPLAASFPVLVLNLLVSSGSGITVFAVLAWLLRVMSVEEQAKITGLFERKLRLKRK